MITLGIYGGWWIFSRIERLYRDRFEDPSPVGFVQFLGYIFLTLITLTIYDAWWNYSRIERLYIAGRI